MSSLALQYFLDIKMKKRVLIVEDEQTAQKFFAKVVDNAGAESHVVSRGDEVIEYLKKNSDIGLILLDLALPDISGLQVLSNLKKLHNKVPVAVLSANDDEDLIAEAKKLGAVEFFTKGKPDPKYFVKIFDLIHKSCVS